MTAPASPTIYVNQNGTRLFVRWRPVQDATDYNLYVSEAGGAYGLEDQFTDAEVNPDGWFFYVSAPFVGTVAVYVTALNVGAEESVSSNVVQKNMGGGGEVVPTAALDHIRKI